MLGRWGVNELRETMVAVVVVTIVVVVVKALVVVVVMVVLKTCIAICVQLYRQG